MPTKHPPRAAYHGTAPLGEPPPMPDAELVPFDGIDSSQQENALAILEDVQTYLAVPGKWCAGAWSDHGKRQFFFAVAVNMAVSEIGHRWLAHLALVYDLDRD